jgi:glycosyltransferase involved in cell wall biosynthesis
LEEIEDKVTYLRSPFATTIGKFATNVYQKIRRRLVLGWLNLRVRGNHYDRAGLWGPIVCSELKQLIAQGYDNVIVTAGPFHTTYHVAEFIRKHHPQVKVILDFRDPWTTNKTSFGIHMLSEKRIEQEKDFERRALQNADLVVAVSEHMLPDLAAAEKAKADNGKYLSIANGFDFDDLKAFMAAEQKLNHRLIFAGSLYDQSDHGFSLFKKFVEEWLPKEPSLSGFKADFFGGIPDKFKQSLQNQHISYNKAIPLEAIYAEIAASQACLLFLTEDINYSISTKLCEYLALGKPVIVFSIGGATAEFIESHGLGISISSEEDLPKLMQLLQHGYQRPEGSLPFDLEQYSVGHLAGRYLELLQ